MARSAPPQLLLDNQLCFALYDASRAMVRAYAPVLGELGLTYPQYVSMLVLWEADSPLSVGDLGARLHLDSGTLTPLLKRLETMGLVTRRRDVDDERRVLVSLTADGTALRDRAAGIPARMLPRYGLSVAEAADLRDRLVGIVESLDEASRVG